MFTRPAVSAIAASMILAAAAASATAQQVTSRTWDLRIPSGGLIATGVQRDHIKNAQLSAIQLSRNVGARVAVVGTFGWARSRDVASADAPKLDVFNSDIGLETCFNDVFNTGAMSLSTFAGIGGGARSYNYRKLDVDATNNLAGYVAAGGELGIRRVAVRIEARDYASGFKPLVGPGRSERRNDVVIMAALRFNRRSGESR